MQRSVSNGFLRVVLAVLMASSAVGAGAQAEFFYSHTRGDQWHLNVTVVEEVLVNGVRTSRVEILNRIAVEILEGEGADGRIWNHYDIAEKDLETGVYKWSAEREVRYRRDRKGRMSELPEGSPVPAVRDVPVFPAGLLKPGDRWSESGRELFDLAPTFGIPAIIAIEFPARYTYVGPVERDGRSLDLVEIEYAYLWRPDPAVPGEERMLEGDWFPIEVEGEFRQEIWWDAAAGRNYAVDGRFSYTYLMNDGVSYTFRGTSEGAAVYAEPLDRDALVQEIEDLDRHDIRAEAVDEGVKVSLEDINFVPDSAEMLPGQETRLAGILEILGRYPDRDISIVGHTARIRGLGDGQILSEERAETVARYIIDSGVRTGEQIMTRGMGNRQPIGDNSTEQGRRRNRRVEIIILEN